MSRSYDMPIILDRSRLCLKKVGHKTEERAWEVARKMYRKHGALLWAFQCGYCPNWHLGTPKNPYYRWLLENAAPTW